MRISYRMGPLIMAFFPLAIYSQTISITNPSFESPPLGNGASAGVDAPLLLGSNTSTVGGWTLTASNLVAVALAVPARAEILNPVAAIPNMSGDQLGVLRSNGLVGVATSGSFYQDLGQSYTANTRYTMTADVGVSNIAAVLSDFGFGMMSDTNVVANRDRTFILPLLLNSNELFQVSLTFETNASPPTGSMGVYFFESSLVGVGGSFFFDNVNLQAVAVPEPATVALVGTSILGAGFALWRYRKTRSRLLESTIG